MISCQNNKKHLVSTSYIFTIDNGFCHALRFNVVKRK